MTDRVVVGGLVLLVIATPICFGTVHPWAFRTAEAVIFLMVAATIIRMRAADPASRGTAAMLAIAAPAGAVAFLIGLQLVPLPPAVVRVLSPKTYAIYRHTLSGWPARVDYPRPAVNLASAPPSNARSDRVASTARNKEQPSGESKDKSAQGHRWTLGTVRTALAQWWYGGRWRPLALAPTLGITRAMLLLSGFALFFIVALYPIHSETPPRDEDPLTRLLIGTILLSGFLVATVGLVEQATWNGKVLWFFVPWDWGRPHPSIGRAIGPFVNPDHFAAYLAMVAPLFAGRALSGFSDQDRRRRSEVVPILCSGALVVVGCAILLSESRAIWGGLVVSFALFGALVSRVHIPEDFRTGPRGTRGWRLRLGLAALTIAVATVVIVGSGGRAKVDTRVATSVGGSLGFSYRMEIWRDTLRMVRDFPLFGVGVGSWPEVFVHYQRGPWPSMFLREAHNDYFQLAAELGLLGVVAVALVGWKFATFIWKRWSRVSPPARITLAALVAGMAVEGFHELFDFSLTIPAIGYLFMIYAALAVRIAARATRASETENSALHSLRRASPWIAGAAAVFALAAIVQSGSSYDLFYPAPKSFKQARTRLLLHPANAGSQLQMASWYWREPRAFRELNAAVWISPNNPYAHDLFAARLAEGGHPAEAREQITVSVMGDPEFASHPYLDPRVIPHLGVADRMAIELGFSEAVDRGYLGAVSNLGRFYEATGAPLEAAGVYVRGAEDEHDTRLRTQLLVGAGRDYARVHQFKDARHALDAAIALEPQDPEPYLVLLGGVFTPQKDVVSAEHLLGAGLDAGVDPALLLKAFASCAQAAGAQDKARAAMAKLIEYEPSYDNLMSLGSFNLARQDYDGASISFRRATEVEPSRAGAWLNLAIAEEGAYRYVAADRDYVHARNLAPNDVEVREHYDAFQKKLASGPSNGAESAVPALGASGDSESP